MLDEQGDCAAAAELMDQALEMVPDWAAGWDLAGIFHEKSGNVVGYVEALFDQYAPQFEESLVGRLGYRVPDLLDALVAEEMTRLGLSSFERALDLGCGTGLMGERLRGKVGHLEGVDISAAMIAETARKGIYDSLAKAELVATLNARRADVDLVTAADVLIYCGALQPVLSALMPAMRPKRPCFCGPACAMRMACRRRAMRWSSPGLSCCASKPRCCGSIGGRRLPAFWWWHASLPWI